MVLITAARTHVFFKNKI